MQDQSAVAIKCLCLGISVKSRSVNSCICLRVTLVTDVFLRSGLKSYLPFPKIVAVGSLRRAIIIIIREEMPFPALEKMFVLTRCFIFLSL